MRARSLFLASLIALACASCRPRDGAPSGSGAPRASAAAGDPTRLTVAIYNVLYALAEKKAGVDPSGWVDHDTLGNIEGLDADVVLFQETNEAWESAIRQALSRRFPHCVFHRPKRFLPEGLGACAKHPIGADDTFDSPVGWFPAQRIRVDLPGGPVELINVHLRPAVAGPEGWWQVHKETRPLRKQEIESYLGRLTRGTPAIVAGDFNEVSEGDLFQPLAAAGFESALEAAHEAGITWRWFGLARPLEAQLDHVTYQKAAFSLVSARIVKGGNSDHFAVVVTLERHRT